VLRELQHRPVPDPRGRHVGEDAVHRAADRGAAASSRPGAGGSAPKHVQQTRRRELPALGLALASSLRPGALLRAVRRLRRRGGSRRCSPTRSTGRPARFLDEDRSPGPAKLGTIDNRGRATSTWRCTGAQELTKQTDDAELAAGVQGTGRGRWPRKSPSSSRSYSRSRGKARRHRWLLPA